MVLAVAAAGAPAPVVAVADPALLEARARTLGLDVRIVPGEPAAGGAAPGTLHVVPVALAAPCTAGTPDPANAAYVLETLRVAVAGCLDGRFAALVTGPVHKGVINDAGLPFTGHTELLAELSAAAQPVMMLCTPTLRVALATTHLPLAQVSAAITRPRLEAVLRVLDGDLRARFRIGEPRILVCSLNPHAGEGGHLGREEIDVIAPVLRALREEGLHVEGPLPADTAFTPPRLAGADAVLAMYHDQGLPVLKHAGFGEAVNVTLGLPFVRTSVDHGTALDLAGSGCAESGSLGAALALAAELAATRRADA